MERNCYMDDLLLSSDSLTDLETLSEESVRLFESRGFKLRKWVANGQSKSILLKVPQCDLETNIQEIDFVAEPMPDSTALGLLWDIENDTLSAKYKRAINEITSRRQMLSPFRVNLTPWALSHPACWEEN